jgi:RNA polymerase sigma-70 factor (ECF subfamily)
MAVHMRWQLNDLAHRLEERPAAASPAESGVAVSPASTASGLSPDARRILEVIESLPEGEQEVFELVGNHGLTHAEAATVVRVTQQTVQRRLIEVRLLLAERLANLSPPAPPGYMPPT